MQDREGLIRDEAYRIWVEKGSLEGGSEEHWYEAERRVAAGSAGFDDPATPKRGEKVRNVAKNASDGGVAASQGAPRPAASSKAKAAPLKGAAVDVAPAKRPGKSPPGRPKG